MLINIKYIYIYIYIYMKKLFTTWTLRDSWQVIDKLTRCKEDKFTFDSTKASFKMLDSRNSNFQEILDKMKTEEDSFWQVRRQTYFRCKSRQKKTPFDANWQDKSAFGASPDKSSFGASW